MEPSVASLTLHPAVLIAAGYECLTSEQTRFLNTLRRHFPDQSHHNVDMITVEVSDCDLGGILNPHTKLQDPQMIYMEAGRRLDNFPYTHKSEIFSTFYYDKMSEIWSDVIHEICGDLEVYSRHLKLPVRHFEPTHQVIHELADVWIYDKISALHLCGLGSKLADAFAYVFSSFESAYANMSSTT